MKKIKKRCLTLLEVILGFSLFAIVFALFMKMFYSTIVLKQKMSRIEELTLDKFSAYQSLDSLCTQIEKTALKGDKILFYTEDKNDLSLNFMIDQGLDIDASASGKHLCTLCIEQKKLILKQTPYGTNQHEERKKTLLDSVESWQLLFHPKLLSKHGAQRKEQNCYKWEKQWHELPHSMELILMTSNKEPLRFIFTLSSYALPILYEAPL